MLGPSYTNTEGTPLGTVLQVWQAGRSTLAHAVLVTGGLHHALLQGWYMAAEALRHALQGGRGSSACRAEGTGALRDVRIINLLQDTLFWFRVDARVPGHMGHSLPWGGFGQAPAWREPIEVSSGPVDQVRLRPTCWVLSVGSRRILCVAAAPVWARGVRSSVHEEQGVRQQTRGGRYVQYRHGCRQAGRQWGAVQAL